MAGAGIHTARGLGYSNKSVLEIDKLPVAALSFEKSLRLINCSGIRKKGSERRKDRERDSTYSLFVPKFHVPSPRRDVFFIIDFIIKCSLR